MDFKQRNKRTVAYGLSCALATMAIPGICAEDQKQKNYIEEIVVTAQKRAEKLQDVAISVTAFSGENIEKMGLRQSTDIAAQTPNYSVGYPNGENGVPSIFVRGVGLSDFGLTNSGPIATYVDEVYVSSNAAQIFQIMDLERVEVLRGPQGTLYGRNATGGAINFITRKPSDELSAVARVSVGNYSSRKVALSVSGPINDETGFRASILKNDSDGWMKNNLNGDKLNGTDDFSYRALFDFQPSEEFELTVNFHGGRTRSDSTVYQHRGVLDPATMTPCNAERIAAFECVDFMGYRETDAYDEGSYDFQARNDTSFWGSSIKLNWDVRGTLITAITAFDTIEDNRPEETDASPNDVLTVLLAADQQSVSQELRISQSHENFNWLVGFYYLKDDINDRSSFDLFRGLRPLVESVDPVSYPGGFSPLGLWSGVESGLGIGPPVFETRQATHQHIKSKAIYGDFSWTIDSRWALSMGIRYTEEEISQRNSQGFQEAGSYIPLMDDAYSSSFNDVSGRIVVNYNWRPDIMFYASITTGFKAGGVNNPLLEPATAYDDESIRNYETGVKSTLMDGRLRLNASLFNYDYSDLQVFRTVNSGGTISNILSNAADASIMGGELELQIMPTDNLFVSLGVGFLDTEYENFVVQGIDPATGLTSFENRSGNEITMAPEATFNGLVLYDVPVNFYGSLQLQVDFNYKDDVYFTPANDPLFSSPGYWLVNARAGWTSNSENYEVSIWARNLADEQYLNYAFDLSELGFHELMLGTPRTFGIEFTYRR